MKKLLALLLLASGLAAQPITLTKNPNSGATANQLTSTSKVIVVGAGGSLTAVDGGIIQASSVAGISVLTTAPLAGGGPLTGTLTLSIPVATNSVNGYLSAADHTTFAAKESVLTFTSPLSRSVNTVSIPVGNFTEATSAILTITGGTGAVVGAGLSVQVKQAATAQAGYLSAADWNTFNGKQDAGNYITALTGDVTAAGPGSAAATLASVATAGTTGSSTAIPVITIDAKGRATTITTAAVVAPAGTLTGTTLAANVVTSSLSAVDTLTAGTWHADVIAGQYGGTGVANTGKTITLGGNLTTSGAFATTLTTSATTALTLPTTGTLATLAGAEALTNKTINGNAITAGTGALTLGTSTISVAGNLTTAGALTTAGSFSSTFTMTNTTAVTFPTTGTLATTAGSVPSIAGTAGNVLVNGGTGSVTGTPATLSLPTALTAINSVTSEAATALTLATGTSGTAVSFASATNVATFFAGGYFLGNLGLSTATFTTAGRLHLHVTSGDQAMLFTTATNNAGIHSIEFGHSTASTSVRTSAIFGYPTGAGSRGAVSLGSSQSGQAVVADSGVIAGPYLTAVRNSLWVTQLTPGLGTGLDAQIDASGNATTTNVNVFAGPGTSANTGTNGFLFIFNGGPSNGSGAGLIATASGSGGGASSMYLVMRSSQGTMTSANSVLTMTSASVTVPATTASTSTTTGSFINSGGFGNAGAAYIGGTLNVTGTTNLGSVLTFTNAVTLTNSTNTITQTGGGDPHYQITSAGGITAAFYAADVVGGAMIQSSNHPILFRPNGGLALTLAPTTLLATFAGNVTVSGTGTNAINGFVDIIGASGTVRQLRITASGSNDSTISFSTASQSLPDGIFLTNSTGNMNVRSATGGSVILAPAGTTALTLASTSLNATFASTTAGTSTTAAAILGKSMGLTENLYVGGSLNLPGNAINFAVSGTGITSNGSGNMVIATVSGQALFLNVGGSTIGFGAPGTSQTITFPASTTIQFNGARADFALYNFANSSSGEVDIQLQRTGTTPKSWAFYIPTGSTDLRFYDGADRVRFSPTNSQVEVLYTTEATAGGAGSVKTDGGVYAAKKIISGTAVVAGTSVTAGSEIVATTNVTAGASSAFIFSGSSQIKADSDGNLTLLNNAASGFTMAKLGGTTSSFPAIKRSAAVINFRLADDSADAAITADSVTTGAPTGGTAAVWKLGTVVTGVTSTFVSTNYIQIDIAGTLYKLATVTSIP